MWLAVGATVACVLLGLAGVGWWTFGLGWWGADSRESDDSTDWLPTGLGVELPYAEIESYEEKAEKLKGLKRASPEVHDLHQACINGLMQRACSSLLALWKASAEIDRLYRMRRTNRLSEKEWEMVEAEFEAFREERSAVAEQASWLRPGWPGGWGESIWHDAHRALMRAREKMLSDGYDVDDPRLPPAGKLRFAPGERVQCNVGKDASGTINWVSGTVITSWDLPYKVALDNGARVTAPQDSDQLIRAAPDDDTGTPDGIDMALWRPYRFKPGDRVACNCGADGFLLGTVLERNILADLAPGEVAPVAAPPGKKVRAAYAIRLDGDGEQRVVLAPMDLERVVRAATPEEEAKAKERVESSATAAKGKSDEADKEGVGGQAAADHHKGDGPDEPAKAS